MVSKNEILLLVFAVVGVLISVTAFAGLYSAVERVDIVMFGLAQLLFGFGTGVVVGAYLGLRRVRDRQYVALQR